MMKLNLQYFPTHKREQVLQKTDVTLSQDLRAKESRRQFVKAGNISLQTAWNKDSSGS